MNILSFKYMDIFLNPVFLRLIFHQKLDIQQHFIRKFMVGFLFPFSRVCQRRLFLLHLFFFLPNAEVILPA